MKRTHREPSPARDAENAALMLPGTPGLQPQRSGPTTNNTIHGPSFPMLIVFKARWARLLRAIVRDATIHPHHPLSGNRDRDRGQASHEHSLAIMQPSRQPAALVPRTMMI